MSDHHFWLTDDQFARLRPLLPNKPRGVPRVDDRRVNSGIIHVIGNGLMWRDAPDQYGPHKGIVALTRAGNPLQIKPPLQAASPNKLFTKDISPLTPSWRPTTWPRLIVRIASIPRKVALAARRDWKSFAGSVSRFSDA